MKGWNSDSNKSLARIKLACLMIRQKVESFKCKFYTSPSLPPSFVPFFPPSPLIIHLCLQYVSSLAPQLLCSIDLDPRLSALGIFMSKMVHSTQAANSGEHSLFICVSSQTLLISRIVYNYKSIRLPEFPMNILLYSIGCIMINYFF